MLTFTEIDAGIKQLYNFILPLYFQAIPDSEWITKCPRNNIDHYEIEGVNIHFWSEPYGRGDWDEHAYFCIDREILDSLDKDKIINWFKEQSRLSKERHAQEVKQRETEKLIKQEEYDKREYERLKEKYEKT